MTTTVRNIEPLPRGTTFARGILARLMAGDQGPLAAVHIARRLWPETPSAAALCERYVRDSEQVYYAKTAVGANDTGDGGPAYVNFAEQEFTSALYAGSLVGKLAVRRVPFNCKFSKVTSGFTFTWQGEGAAAKVSKAALAHVTLGIAKASGLCVLTDDLARFAKAGAPAGADAAVELLRADLLTGCRAFLDVQFIDNSVSAVANVNPASVTSGIAPVQSTGSTAIQLAADFAAALDTLANANEVDSLAWVMTPACAAGLSAKRDTAGGLAFPSININGGTLLGVPVIASNAVPHSTSAGSQVVLVNASGIAVAGLGTEADVGVELSRHATVEMADDAANSSTTPTAASLVSMFQTNSVACGVTAWANWSRVRDSAVYVIDNVHTS